MTNEITVIPTQAGIQTTMMLNISFSVKLTIELKQLFKLSCHNSGFQFITENFTLTGSHLAERAGFCINQPLRRHTACCVKPLLHPVGE